MTVNHRACFLIASGAIVILTVGGRTGEYSSPQGTEGAANEQTAADQSAIKTAGQSFLKAYMDGDAKALAAHWTENGEYVADDGTTIRGRANIEKAYGELFGKKKARSEAEIEVTSIRFPSKDTAIEEGYFKLRTGKEAATTSKYTVLHVREGGKWLMAVVREWPREGTSLRELDWLIGTWRPNARTPKFARPTNGGATKPLSELPSISNKKTAPWTVSR
jgi:uncharacterized protein (TIGR02246 family)